MSHEAIVDERAPSSVDPMAQPLTTLVYDDGPEFDRLLWSMIEQLKSRGLRLAGVAQINEARPGQRRCDMIVEELSAGRRVRISQDRGNMARGCQLDHSALTTVLMTVEASLLTDVDILIVNKFGKEEVEGRGFRGAIAIAMERSIPVLIGIPTRNYHAWRLFSGDAQEGWLIDDTSGELILTLPFSELIEVER